MFMETQKQYFNKMFLIALKISCQNLYLNILYIMSKVEHMYKEL